MNFLKKVFCNYAESPKGEPEQKLEPKQKLEIETVCPHCKKVLDPKPKYKKKCPHCGNYIFVYKDNLVTEQRKKYLKAETHAVNQAIRRLLEYGVSKSDFENHRKILTKRFSKEPSDDDIVWSLFNGLIARTDDYGTLGGIYYAMALFLNDEGKNPFQTIELSRKMSLLEFKVNGLEKVIIYSARDNSCSACLKQHETVYQIKTALGEMPIPCKDCSYILHNGKYPFCRCLYAPYIED